jgi:hypothetical protein
VFNADGTVTAVSEASAMARVRRWCSGAATDAKAGMSSISSTVLK